MNASSAPWAAADAMAEAVAQAGVEAGVEAAADEVADAADGATVAVVAVVVAAVAVVATRWGLRMGRRPRPRLAEAAPRSPVITRAASRRLAPSPRIPSL